MLIKTGQLAKLAGVLPSKIRFYVREGLIQPSDLQLGVTACSTRSVP